MSLRPWLAWALAFAALTLEVALGALRGVDRAVFDAVSALADEQLDLVASAFTQLGRAEITGVLALGLAIVWWRHHGVRGLVPLLLFAGVGIELALKLLVEQPLPPEDFIRERDLLPLVHLELPNAYPSGHALRATFLAALVAPLGRRVGLVAVALAAAVVMTRVWLGTHWLSDAAGGVLLGLALASLARDLGPRRV